MLGRPVLMSIAAAAIGVLSATSASAGCMSCGCGSPVVYSYTYASPCVTYAAPPMYVINQGPAYTLPVYPLAAEPTPVYPYVGYRYRSYDTYYNDDVEPVVYPRTYRNYGYDRDYTWRHRHRHHRDYNRDYNRDYSYRHRYGHHGRPNIGPRRLSDAWRRHSHMPRMGNPHRMHNPMHRNPMRNMAPGFVHPQGKRH